ncbi:MAG: hypothetical protein HZA07_02590 [Nitrospirae bacterium]|nr:hypothetical protein [Nitrospirota bacterium]
MGLPIIGEAKDSSGDAIDHMMPKDDTLEPGDSRVYLISFLEGPLEKDWLFLIGGKSFSKEGIDVELLHKDKVIQRWHWKSPLTKGD